MYAAKLVDGKSTDPIDKNDGYCPCRIVKTLNSKCICKEFRDLLEYLNHDEVNTSFNVTKESVDEFKNMISKNRSEVGIKCKCGIYETYIIDESEN